MLQNIYILNKCCWNFYSLNNLKNWFFYNSVHIGPYDFRDAENVDGITESSHKNGIYSLARNVKEFV